MGSERVCRAVVVLDLNNFEVTPSELRTFIGRLDAATRQWLGSDVKIVKRVYAPEEKRGLAGRLGKLDGWRQGGNGKARDMVRFIRNDVRSFCLNPTTTSALVLCSAEPELARLIDGLRERGVEVFLLCRRTAVEKALVARVNAENVMVLQADISAKNATGNMGFL